MKINQSNLLNTLNTLEQLKANKKTTSKQTTDGSQTTTRSDDFSRMLQTDTSNSYSHLKVDMNTLAVENLMNGHEDIQDAVSQLINGLLERQGITVDQLEKWNNGELDVDEIAQQEAQKMIGPGGPLSPEAVSDRIVNFAIAGFGGDTAKIGIIRAAIDRGFKEAERAWGGELPDITNTTYKLIQEKLDKWMENSSEQTGETVKETDTQDTGSE